MRKFLVFLVLVMCTVASFAAKKKPVDNVPDYRAYIIGDSTGHVYLEDNSNLRYPLASVTKVMTIMLTFDAIRQGKIGLHDKVTVDKEIIAVGGTRIPMKPGEQIEVYDLLKAAAVKSANNAAYALAKYVGGGSIDRFVGMMNAKARKLGLGNELEYHTPAGLPDHMTKKPMDVGTAKGVYLLTIEAMKYPEYLEISSKPYVTIKNGTLKLKSTNHLLGQYGIRGLKTGYHTKSRSNITIIGKKNNVDLVAVVFGGKSRKIRDDKVLDLFKQVNVTANSKKIVDKNIHLITIPVAGKPSMKVKVYPTRSYSVMVTDGQKVNIKTNREEMLYLPIKKGTVVGTYEVLIDGQKVFEDNLVVNEDITE